MNWWRRAALASLAAMTMPAVIALAVMIAALEALKPKEDEDSD